ncbi:MAG: SCO family protein [Flavobacterium sp.]|nr:SCO family protein [Flavobacterium sp.]
MKNKSYIGISFIILIFGIIFIPRIITRLKDGTVTQNDRMSAGNGTNISKTLVTIGQVPQFELTDQNNNKITDKDYLGKVYVVEFFFSTCPSICPVMNRNMIAIQKEFASNKNFGIASITINPDTDTPEVLKKHAIGIGAVNPNWHFLTGDKQYTLDLASKGFNLYAAKNDKINGGFQHSGFFALVDKNGKITSRKDKFNNPLIYYNGLDKNDIDKLKEDIKILLDE